MAIFKCKMCGGTLEVKNESVATCEYCGTQQTLPKLNDERKANLYDRANHFRRNNEFDKAMGIYEQILNEDNTDAESYWSLVLCRYGIEYVEDPTSHKRIPTVNRAQFTSIFDDDNYKSALQYADIAQKAIYEAEANAINEIQKGILAISQKEEPFDVFICYKETDSNGRRTPDSVLANDLYHQLKQEGFKVFFARITLEDKLGSAYEPYIFAALNSAKVMVVIGTKPEYFNAVWVKNEWSRYLALIKNGAKKMLIPAYKDMDPYDLPEEFSHLQAQDMSKLGFMQDLIRGIKKITQADEPKTTVVKETIASPTGNTNIAPLLKRVFMFLEDGDFSSADEYCEKVLDIDPENALAYLGKLMAELRIKKQQELKNYAVPFDEYNNYQKAVRFADEKLKSALISCVEHIKTRIENERLEGIYNNLKNLMSIANSEEKYIDLSNRFKELSGFKDADSLVTECLEKAEGERKTAILNQAKAKARGLDVKVEDYLQAIELLETIPGWKDADDFVEIYKKKAEELKKQNEIDRINAEKRRKRNKKIAAIVIPSLCAIITIIVLLTTVIIPTFKYNSAVDLKENGNYEEAIAIFEQLDDYKDSKKQIKVTEQLILERDYNIAEEKLNIGDFDAAVIAFTKLGAYKDSSERVLECYYSKGISLLDSKEYQNAITAFTEASGFEDADTYISKSYYLEGKSFEEKGEYESAYNSYNAASNYEDSIKKKNICAITLAKTAHENGNRDEAISWYKAGDDKNSAYEIEYDYVQANKNNTDTTTHKYLEDLKSAGYKDSIKMYADLYSWKIELIPHTHGFLESCGDDLPSPISSYTDYRSGDLKFLYATMLVSGGEPGAKLTVTIKTERKLGEPSTNTTYKNENWGRSGEDKVMTVTASEGRYELDMVEGTNVIYSRITVYKGTSSTKLASEEVRIYHSGW